MRFIQPITRLLLISCLALMSVCLLNVQNKLDRANAALEYQQEVNKFLLKKDARTDRFIFKAVEAFNYLLSTVNKNHGTEEKE